ncbi:MAG: phosphate acyltransferase PlsX [Oscillospiraceae bacterium]|nr:phosphate acyltransferase PlsX [Oscillospiraceae bacterium]
MADKIRVIVDAFGGDNAPLEVIKGAIRAVDELGVDITLVGDEEKIRKCAAGNQLDISRIAIHHAPLVMAVETEPTKILKEYQESSMAVGLKMLHDGEGDAFVSGGSTGALTVGATFIVKRMKGIKRCAIGMVLPTTKQPCMVLDIGANSECRPDMLVQFAIMGSAYMNKLQGVENPRTALINIGAEPTKGRDQEVETYKQLGNAPVNFIGNIEAREIPLGGADVAITDGFSGNLVLKTYEGMGKLISAYVKDVFSGVTGKIAGLFVLKRINSMRKKLDYAEYGGAPLLGAAKPVIKAHGSSNATAFYNAIRQAKLYIENHVTEEIAAALEEMKAKTTEEVQNG